MQVVHDGLYAANADASEQNVGGGVVRRLNHPCRQSLDIRVVKRVFAVRAVGVGDDKFFGKLDVTLVYLFHQAVQNALLKVAGKRKLPLRVDLDHFDRGKFFCA